MVIDNGDVYGFGNNEKGQLGNGTRDNQFTPVLVNKISEKVIKVACGQYHSCALTGKYAYSHFFFSHFWNIRIFLSFGLFVCLLFFFFAENGRLWTWGSNSYGQLGLGHFDDQLSPCRVESIGGKDEIIDVSCGSNHTIALTGRVWFQFFFFSFCHYDLFIF